MKDKRYLYAKDKFLEYSYLALQNCFANKDEFISFFETIENDEQKNLFLKTASFYLFLVKKGDWFVDIPNSDKRVDYLTDTYKYIAIFSLIESLQENFAQCGLICKLPEKDKRTNSIIRDCVKSLFIR